MATPKLAHVVFQTGRPKEMSDWYCTVLDGHVVHADEALTFIAYDDEHRRVALLSPPGLERQPKTGATAAMHHMAFTFADIDELLQRYVELRDEGITPAVSIAHGMTTSMYYKDPDGNFVEMQIDRFDKADDATAYMKGAEYAADSVGPAFDPEKLLADRRAGRSVEELSDRSWAVAQNLPPAIQSLMAPL